MILADCGDSVSRSSGDLSVIPMGHCYRTGGAAQPSSARASSCLEEPDGCKSDIKSKPLPQQS